MIEDLDLAIIGSGPAGLSAAIAAERNGLSVNVFDEQPVPGGQIYRSVEASAKNSQAMQKILGLDYLSGGELVAEFRECGAQYTPRSKVWNLSPDGEISLVCTNGANQLRAKRVLIAAGAMERPMPIAGWTLPGVMSAGSAQIQMKTAGQVPDVPFVVAGSGPLLYLVAWQLQEAGAPLIAVLDTTPRGHYVKAGKHALGALQNFSQIKKGLNWIRDLKRAGVSIISNITDLRIAGNEAVEAISWRSGRNQSGSVDCQMVFLHQGVVPNYQLSSLAGCEVVWDGIQMCWHTQVDEWCATNEDQIAVAGDCNGIGGAIAAKHQGHLAGLDAAYRLGKITQAERDGSGAIARKSLRRQSGFRKFLDELYRPPSWLLLPEDSTVVCRCEEVTGAEIRVAAKQGAVGANQLKFYTRAGMGRCQGRMCGLASTAICADVIGSSVTDVGFSRIRPPLRPVTIGEMADSDLS